MGVGGGILPWWAEVLAPGYACMCVRACVCVCVCACVCIVNKKVCTVMLQYFVCEKPLQFCHFVANSSTLRSYLCNCGSSIHILG